MRPSILLSVHPARWQLVRVEGQKTEVRDIAVDGGEILAVAAALKEWNAARAPLCLALPSERFLVASIDCGDLPRKDRQTAMLYRLEEQLPLDIETLTAGFFPPVGTRTLGAAVETLAVKKLMTALAAEGIEPRAICSTALLALWNASQSAPECGYALAAVDGAVDVFRIRDGLPCAWYTTADDADEITRCIQAHRLQDPDESDRQRCLVVAPEDWKGQASLKNLDLEVQLDATAPLTNAAQASAALMGGRDAGWMDFRKGHLAPSGAWASLGAPLRWAMVLGLLLPIIFSAAMVWRGYQYTQMADVARGEQADAYRKLYPSTPVPRLVTERLQSDLRRLGGTSGIGQQIPQQTDALNTLAQICKALPPATRWLILSMRIDPDNILIEGQTRLHSDAETINRSLIDASLDMDPPRTESIAEGAGVTFTLSGSPKASGKERTPSKQPTTSSAPAAAASATGEAPK